ncbi:DeoR/GlpR family DNA-binding transcription regulator [Enterococcus sp. HY326]|uniref:DeoR/GlpR family DNA-binding transcription regulator n=1 Tax=Enterococcus sp. HY326 TaxID=2971265 RepID=UPI00223F02CB|nr:DeoR/GlpR family DNA-binding transcription regulator [Enterococcus sp. HY326]
MDEHLYAEERKKSIVNLVKEKKRVQVAELAEIFNVTGSTIRADLRELENEGLVTRTHGGVIQRDFKRSIEIIPTSRKFTIEKYRIAEETVNLIEENDIIAIDTGTSCKAFAEKLINSSLANLTILTYDLEIALLLSEKTSFQVHIIGGIIRNGYPYVSGSSVSRELNDFSVDKVIVGTTSFDINYGYSTPNYETAEMKKCIMQTGRIKIALCESSKINQRSFKEFARPKAFNYLVTDSNLTKEQQTEIEKLDITLIIV